LEKHKAKWDPKGEDPEAIKTAEPYKTLFVARLNWEVRAHLILHT
jgi:hypothetical protein